MNLAYSLLLDPRSLLPHGYCYLWQPGLLGLHLVSDSIITLSYYSIPLGLVWLTRRRQDLPFNWMFWLFAIFIAGCGTTHLMEIWTLWNPSYWASGTVKAVTAVASVGTAIALVPLLPKVVALPSPKTLEASNRELASVNRELETFSYSVSHDLRAPLRAIDGFAELLVHDHASTLDPEGQRLLRVIRDNTDRMGALIDNLLRFSQLNRKPLEEGSVDMTALAQSVVEDVRRADGGQGVEVVIQPLPAARADQALLRQVLTNLVGNAFKFTRKQPHPRIEVGGCTEPREVTYYVRDNGAGFDMRYAAKLFGVFQRLHRVDEFDGTGVGLALVQRIVHRHGGRVWAEGEVDRGATFHFTLPRGS